MMKISSLIQTLTEVLANYGDKEVALINDATGELRYIESVSVNEFADEVILDHVSYGEATADEDFFSADDEDAEFFIAEIDTSMTDEEFLQTLALLGLC